MCKYLYKQVRIYNICDIYKTQPQKQLRCNSISKLIPGNGAILLSVNIGQATKVLEIFIREFIVSTEISSRERTPFKS